MDTRKSPELAGIAIGVSESPRVCSRSFGDALQRLARYKPLTCPEEIRRLSKSKVTFQELLEDVRRELAHHYLKQAAVEFNEVAFLLGYEDTNSFFRAFQS